MARRTARPAAPQADRLEPYQRRCRGCGGSARVAYHDSRTVATLDGLYALTLVVRRCHDPACPLSRQPSSHSTCAGQPVGRDPVYSP